ncbi:sugar ABC transporter substrate-binding protein [Streptomyces synnematoformans]|uniref:Sugar ABC transporter substrate-binding protein n=1 Tax=Streptomyces synnematoformans TaxID=415721 RepID=A0ABN2XGU5_9ACTN
MRIPRTRGKAAGGPRHLIRGLGVLTALSLALTGCGSGGDSGDGDGKTRLRVSVWSMAETPEFQALFDAFEKSHPKVTIEPVDILADDYPDKVTTMLAGGDDTDVITVKNVTDYSRWSSRGQLADVTDAMPAGGEKDLAGLEAFDSDGSYYALPYRQDFWLLFYNKTLFDQAGVDYPEDLTWDEYVDVAEQLTEDGGDQVYGAYQHVWRSVVHAVAAAQNGGDQLSGDYDFFAEQYETALELQDSGSTLDFGTATAQQADYGTLFESGKAAMVPMGTWYAARLIEATQNGDTDVEWGMAPLPQRADATSTTTFGSPTSFGVNKKAANPDLAKEFVEFAAGEQGAEAITEIGVVPALQSSELIQKYLSLDGMPTDKLSAKAFEPDEIALEMPVSENTSDVDTILEEEHELIMVGEKSIEDGISSMSDRVHDEVLD